MAKKAMQYRDLPNLCLSGAQSLRALWASAGFIRRFGLCRICFRELALQGKIPGVVKSSW